MKKHFLIAEDDSDDIDLFGKAVSTTALPIQFTGVNYC